MLSRHECTFVHCKLAQITGPFKSKVFFQGQGRQLDVLRLFRVSSKRIHHVTNRIPLSPTMLKVFSNGWI